MYSSRSFLTGAAVGAAIPAALALPAAYYYFKNQNKYKNKYNYGGVGYGSSMPWYSSTAFSNSFAPPPSYGAGNSFGNLGGSNLYPRQAYPSNNYFPPSIYASNNRGNVSMKLIISDCLK
jgi:hypothetical protein